MDVRLSDEQVALRDSAAHIVNRLGIQAVGQLDDKERTAKLNDAVETSGWRELRTGDDSGPLASAVEVALVATELGRGLADVPFIGPTLAADLRRRSGTEPSAAETVALRADLSAPGTDVAFDAAGAASALVVSSGKLLSIGLGELGAQVDLTRPVASAIGTPETVDGARGITDDAATSWTALGLAAACADIVGAMDGATRVAVDYAKERRQYGATIGSYQAIQHLLADATVLIDGAWSVTLHAAWAVDALEPDEALAAAAVAKAYCARAARTISETVIQVHGGIGNTWECVAHLYLRRALASADLLGGVGASLDRVLAHHGIGAN